MEPKIIKEPNSLLHQKCESVSDFEEAKQITEKLLAVMQSLSKWWNRWLGFAANQIGHSKRIIALRKGKNEYEVLGDCHGNCHILAFDSAGHNYSWVSIQQDSASYFLVC